MTPRQHSGMPCESLRQRVAKILADEDLMGITGGNPDPIEEYSNEAAEIVRRLLMARQTLQRADQEFLAMIVSDVFRSEFEVDIGPDDAAHIAARIKTALS